jgi:hypothetical protein
MSAFNCQLRSTATVLESEFQVSLVGWGLPEPVRAITSGVQRASVSNTASELQKKDVIWYRRGQITISDWAALTQEACDCHKRLQADGAIS